MSEESVLWNRIGKQNDGVTKDSDERKESEILNAMMPVLNVTEQKRMENPRKKPTCKREKNVDNVKGRRLSSDKNILTSSETVTSKGFVQRIKDGTCNLFAPVLGIAVLLFDNAELSKKAPPYGEDVAAKIPYQNAAMEISDHEISDHKICSNPDIKTLGDCLTYFDLTSYLKQLEGSLEEVRRNKKEKEDHNNFFKQIDKEIQKLSLKYHPDRAKNRGVTDEEITVAQKLQTAINATRTVLKLLNSAFLEDIGTDHKFGFYTELSINSLSNEDEIQYRVYEVIFKIDMISRIKQQNIITEIREFLVESKKCIDSCPENICDFEKYRDLALFHLECCIKGFKKLCIELKEVAEECKSEQNGKNMLDVIQNMARDSERDLKLLKLLEKTAKASLNGKYEFFSSEEHMDPYFVLPLVSYTNVILMCNVMVRNSSVWGMLNFHPELDPCQKEDLKYLLPPYYLASYLSGNKYHKERAQEIMDQRGYKMPIKEKFKSEFYKLIKENKTIMECKFKVENYNNEVITTNLMLDLKTCMTMMSEFQEKQQELSKDIKEFRKQTERMGEKYERFDKRMEETEELNQKVKEFQKKTERMDENYESFDNMMKASEGLNQKEKEKLETSEKLSEKVSKIVSEQI